MELTFLHCSQYVWIDVSDTSNSCAETSRYMTYIHNVMCPYRERLCLNCKQNGGWAVCLKQTGKLGHPCGLSWNLRVHRTHQCVLNLLFCSIHLDSRHIAVLVVVWSAQGFISHILFGGVWYAIAMLLLCYFTRGFSSEGHVSDEKTPGCLGYIGDEILPSFAWTISNHCKYTC